MRSLSDWLARIEGLHPENMELGLERVARVCAKLPSAARQATVLTVAGTNGKGSTVECLMQCLLVRGLSVAAYTSPHLRRFNERIRVDGHMATDAAIVAAFEEVEAQRGSTLLTYFEFATLAAFEVFHSEQADIWILEVGLGGRLDAVNVIAPDVAIITAIGLDHRDWLGDTREEIAREKAGIMRAHQPVICSDPDPALAIATCASDVHSTVYQLGRDFGYTAEGTCWHWQGKHSRRSNLTIPGHAALDNFAGALAALELLDALPDAATLNHVFEDWTFNGRLQVIPGDVEWWLDVAHNRESAVLLATALASNPCTGKCTYVIGMLADKPVTEMLAALVPIPAAWVVVGLDAARALPPVDLASGLAAQGVRDIEVMGSVAAGCAVARARSEPGDRIVVTGSFHAVGPALVWLGL